MTVPNANWTTVSGSDDDWASDSSRSSAPSARPSIATRLAGLITTVHPGEGWRACQFFGYAFLLLVSYYTLKTTREPLLLAGGSAELKSYAFAAIACVLCVMVPFYGVLFRRSDARQLTRRITVFCMATLGFFYLLGTAGVDIGFAYYVWVGVFGVTIIAQFWAHAAHSYDVESGQRLFPLIMAGAALGALVGPPLSGTLFPLLGPWNLMLLAIALLFATLPLLASTSRSESAHSQRRRHEPETTHRGHVLGGFALVLRDRHLLLLAGLAVLLNCVNSTGEFVLTQLVLDDANRQIAADAALDKRNLIAAFYGNYYLAVNALSLIVQVLLVSRVFRWIGVARAILVLPVIALVGYGLVAVLPVFSIIRAVKILENSVDYSIMNTARHALYLPLPTAHQYEGKTTIDTFFWRFGDLAQAALIYVGLNWFGFDIAHFATVNMLLAVVWVAVAARIGKRYADTSPRVHINWRGAAVAIGSAAFAAVVAVAVAKDAGAAPAPQAQELFGTDEPLAIELSLNARELCRGARADAACAGAPATLSYIDSAGAERRIDVHLRPRGKWRADAGNCTIPPLFVSFGDETARGTLFEGRTMLPLTTHCRESSSYEQYVLKEYLAYRIYNLLTDKSLRVRLARVSYRDTSRDRVVERYAFFTEHFQSLAARQNAEVYEPETFDRLAADPLELGTLDLFEFLIGNTDWSASKAHNIVHIRARDGLVTAVPYDFDFSGLVDAAYAGPPPTLPIRTVTQRLFRGFCRPDFDWHAVYGAFRARHRAITDLVAQMPALTAEQRRKANDYVESFFALLDSPKQDDIVKACRAAVTE
jgi:AAA family ATP:ADP antiporter